MRAHIFICMLAYYIEWHMREAWRPVLFCDEDQAAKTNRDPVAPALRSKAALEKITTRCLEDGTAVHSFRSLLADLATITRSTFAPPGDVEPSHTFTMTTLANPSQERALGLLENVTA